MVEKLLSFGEYAAAGLYETPSRSLFYRCSLGIRRYYENCSLAVYRGELLYPSGKTYQTTGLFPQCVNALSYGSLARWEGEKAPLAKKIASEFCKYRPTVPKEHTVAGNMYTHSMPYYERILKEGFDGYLTRIQKIADTDLREGLIEVVAGIRAYHTRCLDYLISENAAPDLISALRKVPFSPAETAYEALVGWNFIMYLDGCDDLGCLARGLAPYHRGEDLVPCLENLFDNIDQNGGYSMALDASTPELTVQCLRAAKGRRRPMIELLIDEDTPAEIWEAALDTLKSGGGQPAFYNKTLLFRLLKERFPSIRDEDFSRFCGGGCFCRGTF